MFSLVIPVYKNEENLPRLIEELLKLDEQFAGELEVVFVVDGSPDACFEILRRDIPALPLHTQLIELSRNFGSFAAIRAGLAHGSGDFFGVLAADLQEPPELMLEFCSILKTGEADVVLGYRAKRADPWLSQLLSETFWNLYRRSVLKDMPRGGVDVFGCTRAVRNHLSELGESDTNLIALLFWIGFRRKLVPYERRARLEGRSAWIISKKIQYALNSIFSFTELPIRLLLAAGTFGVIAATIAAILVAVGRLEGRIPVLGYTPVMLLISFFGGLTTLGLGIVGQYLWLTLQNARQRPNFIVRSVQRFPSKE
jgi:polyisoprenyl-phosphate glycosyltransferase